MRFFLTNSLPEFVDFLSACTQFERVAIAKDEVGKRLLMHEFRSLKDFNQRVLLLRLTQAHSQAA